MKITTPGSEHLFKTPISIAILRREINSSKILHPLILSKTVVGEGGERSVKLCYNTRDGKYVVRKKIKPNEQAVLEHIQNNPCRGLSPPLYFRNQDNSKKAQVIEPLYEGTLATLLQKKTSLDLSQKIDLMIDLLTGLQGLHGMKSTVKINTNEESGEQKSFETDFFLFHADIKPSNVLVDNTSAGWKAFLSDFGFCNNPLISGGTLAYRSPESLRLAKKLESTSIENRDDLVFNHNIQYGQLSDYWSLGLVFVAIMTSQLGKNEVPPLPSLQACLDTAKKETIRHTINHFSPLSSALAFREAVTWYVQDPADKILTNPPKQPLTEEKKSEVQTFYNEHFLNLGRDKVAALTQKQIDTDLKTLRLGQAQTAAEDSIWDLIGEMLQVAPSKRITSVKALQKLTSLNTSASAARAVI